MESKTMRVLFSREDIDRRVKELGEELARHYEGKDLVVISLLRGSFIFAADLIRAMDIDLEIDFMTTASYGDAESSSGHVEIVHDLRTSIEGRDVLIVDDIVDTGRTMEAIVSMLKERGPKSIATCVLLDKPERREVEMEADYVGFTIPDVFIVGCGLNYGAHRRNIPYIYTYDEV